jgi:hypothetical protein
MNLFLHSTHRPKATPLTMDGLRLGREWDNINPHVNGQAVPLYWYFPFPTHQITMDKLLNLAPKFVKYENKMGY